MGTTPVSPAGVLAAQTAANLVAALGSLALVLSVGRVAFGVPLPGEPVGFALGFGLAAAALFGLGLLVAALAPTARLAGAAGALLFFPMMLFAGLWLPRAAMPDAMRQIGDFTPLGAGVAALERAAAGDWPQLLHLAVMAAYAVIFALAARSLFRWE